MARYNRSPSKPIEEPFREWDLEICHHCKAYQALDQSRCGHCGYPRNVYDQNMADSVHAWRCSDPGKRSWDQWFQRQTELQARNQQAENWVRIVATPIFFLGGFIIFGSIGFLFGIGMLLGIMGGLAFTALAWVRCS